jgi:acetyl-CoA acetyltransferase
MAAAMASAAGAIATGQADCVVVYRGLAQGQFGRFGQVGSAGNLLQGDRAFTKPYGCASPGETYAMRFNRWLHENQGRGLLAQRAVSLTAYRHAQNNPRAVMYGRELDEERYDSARRIVEPWGLFDFCQENDGAAAVILMPFERARTDTPSPIPILAVAQGAHHRWGARIHNSPLYASANFTTIAPRLWEMAGCGPADVDVVQSYENFSGGVVMSLVEHGLCTAEEVDEVLSLENLSAPSGRIPLNTSGGHLAEAYMHGMNLTIEAVRQLRGESVNQVPGARTALVTAGPLTAPVSDLVLTSEVDL